MKNKLLVISPSVPHYDQNAGDLRLFSVLEIISKWYEITYLPQAVDFCQDNRYISCLKDLDITVINGDYSFPRILKENRFKASILEFYYVAEYYLPRIKILQSNCPVIVDTVDIHYSRLYLKYQVTKDKKDLQKADQLKRREINIYKKADVVITVTDEDGIILAKDCPNLSLRTIPTIHRVILSDNIADRNELVFVGGFIHDPNIDAVLYFCKDILPKIRERIPDIRFTIVGSNPPPEVRALNNNFITVTGYVPSTTPYLHKSYISVAPLRYGAGMKGKIGEAMAHGLPVVTTSVGAQGMGLIHKNNAMIADSSEDFAKAVMELIGDRYLYQRIKENGVRHIENNYSVLRVGQQVRDILIQLDKLALKRLNGFEKLAFFLKYVKERAKHRQQLSRIEGDGIS